MEHEQLIVERRFHSSAAATFIAALTRFRFQVPGRAQRILVVNVVEVPAEAFAEGRLHSHAERSKQLLCIFSERILELMCKEPLTFSTVGDRNIATNLQPAL